MSVVFFQQKQKKARLRVVRNESEAPLVLRGAAKELAEDNAQLRRYQQFLMQELQALLSNDEEARELAGFLRHLTYDALPSLLAFMAERDWFAWASLEQRVLILHFINNTICRLRVREGLAPIDDSLPGEDPSVFEICRQHLVREESNG